MNFFLQRLQIKKKSKWDESKSTNKNLFFWRHGGGGVGEEIFFNFFLFLGVGGGGLEE